MKRKKNTQRRGAASGCHRTQHFVYRLVLAGPTSPTLTAVPLRQIDDAHSLGSATTSTPSGRPFAERQRSVKGGGHEKNRDTVCEQDFRGSCERRRPPETPTSHTFIKPRAPLFCAAESPFVRLPAEQRETRNEQRIMPKCGVRECLSKKARRTTASCPPRPFLVDAPQPRRSAKRRRGW
jgi:hypothetical protein